MDWASMQEQFKTITSQIQVKSLYTNISDFLSELTHVCFGNNGLISRTNWVNQHQKGKYNILDSNAEQDNQMTVTSVGPYANHLHLVLAPDR